MLKYHETFAKRFQNEDALQNVLAHLFSRMPSVSDVRIVQGRSELGKDVVFLQRIRLARSSLTPV